jgi:hypothetical protein
MTILSNSELLGSIIPNPYVSRITLESAQYDPPKREEPHIQTEQEDSNITTDESIRITVEVILRDLLYDDFVSNWFNNDDIKRFLKLRIIQSTDQELTELLMSENNAVVNGEAIINTYPSLLTKVDINLQNGADASNEDPIEYYSKKTSDGGTIFEVKLSGVFTLPYKNPKHLTYFAICIIDINALAEEYDLPIEGPFNEDFAQDLFSSSGEKAIENVFDNFALVSNSLALFTPSGDPYQGPVRKVVNATSTGFDILTPGGGKLISATVPNPKIQDFRNVILGT